MKRLPLLLLPLLAACAAPVTQREGQATLPGLFPSLFHGPEAQEPPAPEPLPPQVLAALPPGVPPSVVQRGVDGCFLLAIEVTDPPSGYPLRDSAGNPVCEGGLAPVNSADLGASSLMPGNITPPAPLAPLNPG